MGQRLQPPGGVLIGAGTVALCSALPRHRVSRHPGRDFRLTRVMPLPRIAGHVDGACYRGCAADRPGGAVVPCARRPGIGRSPRGRRGPRAGWAANPSLAKDSITSRHNDHREAGLPGKRDRHTERQSMVATHGDHNRPGRSTLVGDRLGGPGKFFSHRPSRAAQPPWLLLRLQHRANLIVQVDLRRPEAVHHVGGRFGPLVKATLGRLYIDDLDPSRSASKDTPGSCQGPAGRIRSFEPDHQHQGTLFVSCRHLPDLLALHYSEREWGPRVLVSINR